MSIPKEKTLFERFDFDLAKQDAITALKIWIVLELGSFILVPQFQLLDDKNRVAVWLGISIPLGLIGSLLVGFSSEFIHICQEYMQQKNKKFWVWMGQFGGWLGLAGVGFPLSMVAVELWYNLTSPK
jgi:hypothetical protein